MVIKVSCVCGCRYSFEVQPVNGEMPVPVHCPKCGLDGTAKANAILAQVLPKTAAVPAATTPGVLAGIPLPPDDPAVAPAPAIAAITLPTASAPPVIALPPPAPTAPFKNPPVTVSPPTPATPAIVVPSVPAAAPVPAVAMALPPAPPPPPPAPTLPPPPPAPSGLTVKRRAPEAAPAATAPTTAAPSGEAPAAVGGLKVKGVAPSPHVASASPAPAPAGEEPAAASNLENPHARKAYVPKEGPAPSFPRGMLGAAIGTVVGCLIWFAVYYFGEINFGFLALIPAVMGGVLGRVMAREDNTWIGVTAAVFTVLGIFGTNYAMAAHELEKEFGGSTDSLFPSYDVRMAEAKEAAAAKTDDEIRTFLQNRQRKFFEKFADKGEKYKPEGISKDEVDSFKQFEQKELQDFASGKPSREDYEKEISSAKKAGTWFARILTAVTAVISAGIFGIFSLIMAVSIAYRTGSG